MAGRRRSRRRRPAARSSSGSVRLRRQGHQGPARCFSAGQQAQALRRRARGPWRASWMPAPLDVDERALDVDAQHAGHARGDRRLGRAPCASASTCRSSLIRVGRKPVVPKRRCAAPIAAMASGEGSSLNSTPPPPLTWVSMKPGSSRPPSRSTALARPARRPRRRRAAIRPPLDHERAAFDDPVVGQDASAVEDAPCITGSRVTLLRCGGRSGSRPRATASALAMR